MNFNTSRVDLASEQDSSLKCQKTRKNGK